MRAWLVALVVVPRIASAQIPVYPNGTAPTPPVNLDPSASGSQAPPVTPQGAPKPNVVVVKPDGTMTYAGDQAGSAQGGYYVDTGSEGAGQPPVEIHNGPVPELHVVRSGDTLWDICWFYFNDPWQWPKVWSYNPQITNPHWIYPGDLVRLLPRGVFASLPDNEPEKATPGVANKPPDVVPPPQRRIEVGIKQVAFVEQSDLDKSITLDGSVDEKVLLGNGDSVYLAYPPGKPPKVGQRYSIYRPDNPVKSGKKNVGAYVHVLGEVEVVSVREDKRARGVIVQANQEIERGLKVGPLIKEYKTVPPALPKVDAQGTIVARLQQAALIGQGELVFVDLGKASGLEVGNRMQVIRRGDAYPVNMDKTIGQDDRRFPVRSLGEVVIVEVGDKISVGLVTLAVQEFDVGDLVWMQKAK